MDNNNKMTSFKKSFNNKSFRLGGYSTIIGVVVIAIAIVLNLLVAQIPSSYTKIDTSSLKIYTISDETKEIVKAIDMDITIYMIAETGKEDSTIYELVGRYTSINNKIKLKMIDPVLYPNFAAKYTADKINPSSLIVESAKRSYVIDYTDIYVTNYAMDYNTGEVKTSSAFAGESKITSALDYVVSDDLPMMYILTGHGEAELTTTMSGYITNDNIATQPLTLLTSGAVPDDADSLLINSPTMDITADEAKLIIDYLEKGGDLILITGFSESPDLPNLYSVGKYYGIEAYNALVVEGSANNYYGYPYHLLPKMGSHAIIDLLDTKNMYVMLPYSMGLKTMETLPRSTITVTPLLYTSASAYAKTGSVETLEKIDNDIPGAFNIAVAVNENDTNFIWYASSFIVDETADTYVSGGNSKFFLSTLSWLFERTASVSIASKTMQVAALMVSSASANLWGAVIVIILPVTVIAIGLAVWLKRRKR